MSFTKGPMPENGAPEFQGDDVAALDVSDRVPD